MQEQIESQTDIWFVNFPSAGFYTLHQEAKVES